MTRAELLADLDDATREFAEQIAAEDQVTTGIPKPARIEVTESAMDPERVGFIRNINPTAEALPEQPTPPGGGGCQPCERRHLSIRFRIGGSIQTDGCFPNSGLLSWDCGFNAFTAPSYETDVNQCSGGFNFNMVRSYSGDSCNLGQFCSCGGCLNNVCNWYGGLNISLLGTNTIHFDYHPGGYYAGISSLWDCHPAGPTWQSAIYDSSVNGPPALPPDIIVPDWCTAAGSLLFSYNLNWRIDFMDPAGCPDCAGTINPKRVVGSFGMFVYINVT